VTQTLEQPKLVGSRDAMPAIAAQRRWPLYLIEAVLLAVFMIAACGFGVLMEHPDSPVRQQIDSPLLRRILMGAAMGLTAVILIYSPWGKRSGALMNPAMTLTFWRLGRLNRADTIAYATAQFAGGVAGVGLAALAGRMWLSHESVRFVATSPGPAGPMLAWMAEYAIAFVLVTVVFSANRHPRLIRATGLLAGLMVATFIITVAPVSGMSLNPARSVGSSVWAQLWTGWWIYCTAPVAGMLSAAQVQQWLGRRVCGRLTHDPHQPGMFRCDCTHHSGDDK
jgi:aquaporin Z